MLRLIAAVYHERADMQERFWLPDETEGPYRFLKFVAGENLAEWFFVPFIDMVASLASRYAPALVLVVVVANPPDAMQSL